MLVNDLNPLIRLPLKALILLTCLALALAGAVVLAYVLSWIGGLIYNSTIAWNIVKWTFFIVGGFIILLCIGAWLEDQ